MIRLLVVDEIRLMCDMMSAAFRHHTDMQVIGCATQFDEAMRLAPQSDVMLVSSTLPGDGAMQLTRAFKFSPATKVIVVGLPEADGAVIRYMEAGAAGFVCREKSVDELLRTIRCVYNGKALISPELAAAVIARMAELAEWAKPVKQEPVFLVKPPDLTERERQVLILMAQGLRNQEIAERLTIELGTAKNHVHRILRKLNVKSREEAVAFADSTASDRSNLPRRPSTPFRSPAEDGAGTATFYRDQVPVAL